VRRCLDNGDRDSGEVVSFTCRSRFTPQKDLLVLTLEAESTPGHSAAGRIT
jgi:hypothetical protein